MITHHWSWGRLTITRTGLLWHQFLPGSEANVDLTHNWNWNTNSHFHQYYYHQPFFFTGENENSKFKNEVVFEKDFNHQK
jgi:hypothetical protein